jgi:glycerol-3-phosphate acyltransferase PlsY
MLTAAILCGAAYLVGSIPTGMLVARARGIDLRAVGSGNIGATNVARALGRGWAIAVLIGDALKGFLPVFIGRHYLPQLPAGAVALAGLAAIVGHMFTVFLRGRGGKGVATSLGVALAISPPAALCGLGMYLLAYLVTRISSVGSLLGMWSFPLFAWLFGNVARPYLWLSLGTAALVTVRHRANISRLMRGEEKRT